MLETRSTEPEYLDSADCDPELANESYRFMEKVNRHFGGISNVRRFIESEIKKIGPGSTLRVLDIGSGNCDIPIAICRWAESKGFNVHFTCLEIFDPALALAKRNIESAGIRSIDILREDVFKHHPAEPYDCAVSSMCFHHFKDGDILRLVGILRGSVKGGILINDLRRSHFAWLGAFILTRFSHPGVRHDAMQSVKRGFKVCELRRLLLKDENNSVKVRRAWFFRVNAVVRSENTSQFQNTRNGHGKHDPPSA
ncbi:MAG TPA: methyltransferase type 12 [Lentisphaeria bacterium]|nr:MAG: hypothetical protein A2X45_14950 [Lentisphaerae bacterium GWF2_50_93]HCE46988.1 methyltransferase type 12 [Lentisphaeria bacterium]